MNDKHKPEMSPAEIHAEILRLEKEATAEEAIAAGCIERQKRNTSVAGELGGTSEAGRYLAGEVEADRQTSAAYLEQADNHRKAAAELRRMVEGMGL